MKFGAFTPDPYRLLVEIVSERDGCAVGMIVAPARVEVRDYQVDDGVASWPHRPKMVEVARAGELVVIARGAGSGAPQFGETARIIHWQDVLGKTEEAFDA